MIRFVPFEDLDEKHLDWIAESVLAAPEAVRVESADFLRAIKMETMRLFDWDDGCVLVGIVDKRLIIYGFCCHNLIKRLPDLVADLKRLAADWQCDAIETNCFSRVMTSAMKRVGAVVESTTLVLTVE
jgi:hypothetical protein